MKLNLTLYRNEVVPVYTTDKGNKVVNARELHSYLQVKEKFNDWARRVIKTQKLSDSKHFTTFTEKTAKGRPTKEYIFLLDPAKKIAMGTNNDQGNKVKDYFLECEKVAIATIRMPSNLMEHTQREVQVSNSKAINHYIWTTQEAKQIPEYHREATKIVCGKTPSQLKKDAKASGLPSKYRTSGREVLRHDNPPAACALSLCDTMYKGGVSLNDAAPVLQKAASLYGDLMQLGLIPKELAA